MNSQIQVMDLHKEEEVMKYTGHMNSNVLLDNTIVNYKGETYLISGSEDGNLYLWNVNESQPLKKQIYSHTINCLGINNNGVLATAGFPDLNQSIKIYKLNDI
jgi:WD40 repeat protein